VNPICFFKANTIRNWTIPIPFLWLTFYQSLWLIYFVHKLISSRKKSLFVRNSLLQHISLRKQLFWIKVILLKTTFSESFKKVHKMFCNKHKVVASLVYQPFFIVAILNSNLAGSYQVVYELILVNNHDEKNTNWNQWETCRIHFMFGKQVLFHFLGDYSLLILVTRTHGHCHVEHLQRNHCKPLALKLLLWM